jgi:hypothetical protein
MDENSLPVVDQVLGDVNLEGNGVVVPVPAGGMTLLTTLGNAAVPGTMLATSQVAYSDDFEGDTLVNWDRSGGTWTWATGPGQLNLSCSESECLAMNEQSWTDVSLEAKVNIREANGNAGLVFRAAGANDFYTFRLNASTQHAELYKKVSGTMTLVAASSNIPVSVDKWYTLKADAHGSRIQAFVDGYPIFDWTNDIAELQSGSIGVRSTSDSSYDDVVVVQ